MYLALIYPGYKDGHSEISLLILEDPLEHTEVEGGEDLPGWFYNDDDIVIKYNWDLDENTNEACDKKYFTEDGSYMLVRQDWGDWEDFLFKIIFEDEGFAEFVEREL